MFVSAMVTCDMSEYYNPAQQQNVSSVSHYLFLIQVPAVTCIILCYSHIRLSELVLYDWLFSCLCREINSNVIYSSVNVLCTVNSESSETV